MKILVDMNLSPTWVPFLVTHGIEAVHWSAIGEPSASDSQIFDYAAENDLVVFTHDLDFAMLLAACKSRGPSVIQVRTQDVLPSAIGAAILRAIEACRDHLETGAIVSVDLIQNRLRLLPLWIASLSSLLSSSLPAQPECPERANPHMSSTWASGPPMDMKVPHLSFRSRKRARGTLAVAIARTTTAHTSLLGERRA